MITKLLNKLFKLNNIKENIRNFNDYIEIYYYLNDSFIAKVIINSESISLNLKNKLGFIKAYKNFNNSEKYLYSYEKISKKEFERYFNSLLNSLN